MLLFLTMLMSGNPVLDDYLPEALRHRWQGTTEFTLDISAEGTVVSCNVTQSSGHKLLDDATCDKLIKRARFRPATDPDGKPISSTYSSRMIWKIGN